MKNLFFLFLFLLGLTSCEKFLEIKPTNRLVVSTYDDVKALMGAHIRMFNETDNTLAGTSVPFKNEDLYYFFAFQSDDLNTDRFLENYYTSNFESLYIESLNWENEDMPGNLWSTFFSNIGFYNTIIDKVNEVEATETEKDIVRNEAKFLRAWYLFKLLQWFSPYLQNDLGIPVNLNSEAVGEADMRRRTQTEVYNYILTDLTDIINSETQPRESYNIFFDKLLAHALLAEVYLFKSGSGAGIEKDYTAAIEHAKIVLEGYVLPSPDSYEPFINSDKTGVFKNTKQSLLTFVWYDYYYGGMYNIMSSYGIYQFPTDALYSIYKDNDVRKKLFFGTEKNITKFDDVADMFTKQVIFNYFHYAEMYLIIAESYARLGDNGNARIWLEDFQRSRYRNYEGFKGADLLQEILNERRREFCLEQDARWCDLIRNPKGWTRKSYQNEEEPEYTIEDNDYRFCLPIPLEEELQNNHIKQNPGWNM